MTRSDEQAADRCDGACRPGTSAGAVPLEDYVLLGDTRTAGLLARGSIDWLCLPRFDSAPVFGRLVGGAPAGRFSVAPAGGARLRSGYRRRSAVAETLWEVEGATLRATDGFVTDVNSDLLPRFLMVRRIEAFGSPVAVVVEFDPRRGDTHERPYVEERDDAVVCTWNRLAVAVTVEPFVPLPVGTATTVVVTPGRPLTIAVAAVDDEPLVYVPPTLAWERLEATDRWWRGWADRLEDFPVAHDAVVRSLLTLRLLTYAPSGAPLAAATTSLPERIGGTLNWDYRFSWPRDASIGVAASLAAGNQDEADAFLYWLTHAGRVNRPRLPPAMSVDGRPTPSERLWHDWPGYADSTPVRIGNEAASQHQLDGYGWIVDAAWQYHRVRGGIFGETWRLVRQIADFVAEHWREPDAGIWERRDEPRHYVHSKLMAWLALDRAIALAADRRGTSRHVRRWQQQRKLLAADIRGRGFDHRRQTYVQDYDSDELDAALLLLPVIGFEPPGSSRVAGTIEAVRSELSAGGPLLYRSSVMIGHEGAFLPCSFWLVQALAATGRTREGVRLLDQLLPLASPAGLLPEEIDPVTRRHLGNTPMVFSHAALVQAAMALAAGSDAGAPAQPDRNTPNDVP